ncbi:MAG: hypothetical protein CEN90_664 [Parcubacteria group bacterium Licking1014_17]|nr:MAG: hypothetical protein CEN90_664 [Parcubacteria group bacterium Licking1014_17]
MKFLPIFGTKAAFVALMVVLCLFTITGCDRNSPTKPEPSPTPTPEPQFTPTPTPVFTPTPRPTSTPTATPTPTPTPTPTLVNDAECVRVKANSPVEVGAVFTATVKMRNTGTKPWSDPDADGNDQVHKLVGLNPLTWGTNEVSLPSSPINPGQTVVFHVTATAPTTAGTYGFSWQMIEGQEWFGELCSKDIIVNNPVLMSIIVTYPVSGSVWHHDDEVVVMWNSTGYPADFVYRIYAKSGNWEKDLGMSQYGLLLFYVPADWPPGDCTVFVTDPAFPPKTNNGVSGDESEVFQVE